MVGKEDLLFDDIEADHLENEMDDKVKARDKDEELEIISSSRFQESF